jgi:hypothetical protein
MELQHVNVKLLLGPGAQFDLATLVPIFNTWIQTQSPGDLLLDIADYRHVPAGPGVIIIGNLGNYSVDNTGARLGVRYNRKAALDGTNQDRLAQATKAALLACQRLEADPLLAGKLKYGGQEIEISINDRLLVPNIPANHRILQGEFDTFARKLFGGGESSLSFTADPRSLFTASIKSARTFSVADLLTNVSS